MEPLVLSPLNSLETHLNALVTSLTQTNTFSTAPQLAKDLIADDDDLTSSLNLLQRHQQNYARILNLRAEVSSLQDQLKDTIRRCVSLRQEIGQVNPSILSEADDDDDDDNGGDQDHRPQVAEVDYHTLLTFAARIGKHNTMAAREAEAEAVRRKVAASRTKSGTATAAVNGLPPTDGGSHGAAANGPDNATAETEAEIARVDNNIALTRAQMGMAFPDANVLRVGALGQLQLLTERHQQSGTTRGGAEDAQAALEREVGKLVRESEDVAEPGPTDDATDAEQASWQSPVQARRSTQDWAQSQSQAAGQSQSQFSIPGLHELASQRPPKPPKRKVDLDFPSSDEEDDA